jgi:hypothetical protein
LPTRPRTPALARLDEGSRSTDSDRSGLDDASLRAIEPRQLPAEPEAVLKVADAGTIGDRLMAEQPRGSSLNGFLGMQA